MTTPLGHKTFESWQKATKLSKVKKIELSVKGDIDSALGELRGEISNARGFFNVANNYITDQEDNLVGIRKNLVETENEAKEYQSNLESQVEEGETAKEKAYEAANDLGVDPFDLPGYDELDELINEGDEVISEMNEIKQMVQNIIVNL
tara:strand:+ start:200 stop:646 length:447 start_codon:yes stop_codon:yes gene_type:complete